MGTRNSFQDIKTTPDSKLFRCHSCFGIEEQEWREMKRKSSHTKLPRFIYSWYTTLELLLMLQCTIWIFPHDLTRHQHNSSQTNHATSSDVTSPLATSLSSQTIPPPSWCSSLVPPDLLMSPPFNNSTSFQVVPKLILINHVSTLASCAMTVSPLEVQSPPRTSSNGCGFAGYCSWNCPTVCIPSTNLAGFQVSESYPVQHLRYCNSFWYYSLSSMHEASYCSSPSTSMASGVLTSCPTRGSSPMGSRSETHRTQWMHTDTGRSML